MRVISVVINNNSFIVEKIKIKSKNNVDNSQVINNTFYFTEKYLKKNVDSLKDFFSTKSVDSVIYKDFDSFLAVSPLVSVSKVKFDISKALSNRVMDLLLQDNLVKDLECYFMPSDYVHLFALKNISIKFTNNMMFSTDFVMKNQFKNMKSIYYIKSVNFYTEEEVFDNLESFLKVNNCLELINLYSYSDDEISFIISTLESNKFNNVNIFIHQNDSNIEDIMKGANFLKKVNKKYSDKTGREIKIIYSNEYFSENIFKQLTINGLKLSMVFLLYLGVVFTISQKYHEYLATFNLRLLEQTLANEITTIIIDEINDEEVNPPALEPAPVEEGPKEYINYYANIPTTYDRLLLINPDVVGWVQVNNTKVNYPVTQSSDNNYYLEHDIYNKKIITGWVFMDYRNNPEELDDNTIIYGHNLISGYMFGDLKYASDRSWYTNPENQIITFNTLNNMMKWRIVSVYKTDYTTDYLKTNFFNDEQFMQFVDMIKSRSIYDFNVNVKPGDKILTLSTCTGSNNRRLAIHAVLIEE